jgi:hypothetical protein
MQAMRRYRDLKKKTDKVNAQSLRQQLASAEAVVRQPQKAKWLYHQLSTKVVFSSVKKRSKLVFRDAKLT